MICLPLTLSRFSYFARPSDDFDQLQVSNFQLCRYTAEKDDSVCDSTFRLRGFFLCQL